VQNLSLGSASFPHSAQTHPAPCPGGHQAGLPWMVGEPIDGVTGRLGWSALRTQDPCDRTASAAAA
jgi:hypothetical protein